MNPGFEKPSHGVDTQATEVLMPGDLRFQQSQNAMGNAHISPAPMQQPTHEYPEKAYGQPQMPPPQQRSVSGQFRQAVAIPNLGMSAAPVDCPACGQRAMTNVSYHTGNTTHVWAGVACCLTGLLCFVPYLMNSLKDVQHRCGNCGVLLATWHKSGVVEVHMHG
ncbi:LITAF-like zinc ribbon domain-containing protein [Cladophialophora immunda]|nr:LITAF-like zinc ribbon domain-containing protein [Cladophialophora immunda]